MPNKYSAPFQEEYEKGYRAGWRAALAGNFTLLHSVEMDFADRLVGPWEYGFTDAWDEAERQNLLPDNDDEEDPSPQVMRIIPA